MDTVTRKPRWGAIEVIVVYLGILATGILFSVFSDHICNLFSWLGISDNEFSYFTTSFIIQFVATVILVLVLTVGINKAKLSDIGIKGANPDNWLKYGVLGGLLLSVIIMLLGFPINYIRPDLEPQAYEEMLRAASSTKAFVLMFIMGTIIAPLSEELFYRGMIYPVCKKHLGFAWGAVVAGVIFGLAHWDLWRAIPLSAGGIILCFIYEKTGSIFVSALAHGIWNGVMSLAVYYAIISGVLY